MSKRANGEGSIYKRSDNRWVASLLLSDGKRQYLYGASRADVHAKLTRALGNQQKGQPVADSSVLVSKYLEAWLDSVAQSVRPRTFESYKLNVHRLVPLIGGLRLKALSPMVVDRAYADLLASGLSPRSVEQCHAVLHRALRQGIRWGLLGTNPTEAANVPRAMRGEMRTLNEDQVKQLFKATADDRLSALWVLLATTGLRLGEALGLTWGDIDVPASRLTVLRALQRQAGQGLVLAEPKTAKSKRTVYLPSGTLAALQTHRIRQLAEQQESSSWNKARLVFVRKSGQPLDPGQVSTYLSAALAKANLPKIRVHDLRHTVASLLLARGTHPKVVQELLGHSTITLTLDTYSHVTPGLQKTVAQEMQALFS